MIEAKAIAWEEVNLEKGKCPPPNAVDFVASSNINKNVKCFMIFLDIENLIQKEVVFTQNFYILNENGKTVEHHYV